MASQPMNDVDRELLALLGQSLTSSLSILAVSGLCYGIVIPVLFYYLWSLSRTSNFTKRTITSLGISLVGCLLLTISLCARLVLNSLFVHTSLIAHPELTLLEKRTYTNGFLWVPNVLVTSSVNLLPPLADSIVVWRAWIIFDRKKILFLLPFFLLFSSYAVVTAYIVSISRIRPEVTFSGILLDTLFPLSIATNLIATGFVMARFWAHRRRLPPEMRASAWSLKLLIRLIESGALYFLLQLIYLFVALFGSNHVTSSLGDLAEQIFLDVYIAINGIYPTIVSLIVKNSGHNQAETITVDESSDIPTGERSVAMSSAVEDSSSVIVISRERVKQSDSLLMNTGTKDSSLYLLRWPIWRLYPVTHAIMISLPIYLRTDKSNRQATY